MFKYGKRIIYKSIGCMSSHMKEDSVKYFTDFFFSSKYCQVKCCKQECIFAVSTLACVTIEIWDHESGIRDPGSRRLNPCMAFQKVSKHQQAISE